MRTAAKRSTVTVISGEVSLEEVVKWISRELPIPKGSEVKVWVGDDPLDMAVNLGNPLRFTVQWTGSEDLALQATTREVGA